MNLFLKDQRALILIYLVQLILVPFIFWLDGYGNFNTVLYAMGLSLLLLAIYFLYRYLSNKDYYRILENPEVKESDLDFNSFTPISTSLKNLLDYRHFEYMKNLHLYKNKLDDHIQFINQWVHQMKTPVSVIKLYVQHEDDPKLMAIEDELDRLERGLETILYTSRIDTFEHDFYVEELSLEKLIRHVLSEEKRLFIRKKVFPVLTIEEGLTIVSDEKWLSFILKQLLTNAVKYTIEENRKIYVRGYRRGKKVSLEIQDEGVGIPSSDLPRIFDPYFTGENGRKFQESTGMGLYLVKKITEKLGARVEVESIIGEGTKFRLIF